MEITVDKTAANVAKVQFTVSKEEFQKEFQRGLSQVQRNSRMKGFRPGKVPPKLIEKQHGEAIRDDIKQHFLRQAYSKAVEENSLRPMAHPRVPKDDTALSAEGAFQMEFEISLRPELALPEYKGMQVESELEPVLDTNIEQALEEFRRQQSRAEEAEGGIEETGLVLCTVTFLHGDEEVFRREGLRLSPKTAPPGVEAEAFREALIGKHSGDSVELPMTLPETLPNEAVRGQAGLCRLEISQAFNMVPPTNQELCELLEVADDAALREKVRESLAEASQERESNRIESALLDRLIEASKVELPAPVLEEQTANRLHGMANRLAQSGMPHEEIEKEIESQRETARLEATKGLTALLIVEQIGEAEDLMVNQEDIQAELLSIATRNRTTPEEVREYYAKNNLGQQMAIELLERKVRKFLREQAVVKEPS